MLGREILSGANDAGGSSLSCRVVTHGPGNAEVHHLDRLAFANNYVGGLNVAVNNTGSVGNLKRGQDARDILDCLLNVQALFGNDLSKQLAANQLHDDEWSFDGLTVCIGGLFFTGVINPNDGWVGHARTCLRLLSEARFEVCIIGKV